MAYSTLGSFSWGSSPTIPVTISYDHQRSGADMQYKVKVVVGATTGIRYFGYPIYLTISLDSSTKVNGYTMKAASPSQWSSDITYESGWLTVSGKTTGTTALSVKIYSGLGSSRSGTYNYSLTVDPGISTLAANNGTLGTAQTLTVTRYNTSFTHTITYTCGATSGTIATKSSSVSISWTPPLTLASQNTNGTSVSIKFTITTYEGTTVIGTSTKTITATIPSTVVPTISSVSITEATTGIAAKFNAFVQNKSTLSVVITASGSYGSTITNYETYIQSVPYRTQSFTSSLITVSGTIGVVTTVTDSRGRTAKVTNNITVLSYSTPVINSMSAFRITTGGAASDDGNRIAVSMNFEIASVNGNNDRTFALKYRKSTDTEYTTFSSGTASTNYNDTQYFTSSPEISTDYAYVIRLEITDFFTTVVFEVNISTAFTIMDFRNTGKGMAIGKVSEKDALEIAMNMEVIGQAKIFAPNSDVADSGYLRLYRKDGTLAAFLATSDGGNGLNLHFYENGSWKSVVKFTSDGAIVAKNLSYGTATTG